MSHSIAGSSCAGRAQRARIPLRRAARLAVSIGMGVLSLAPVAARAESEVEDSFRRRDDVVIRHDSFLPVALDLLDPFGDTALIQRQVRIRPIVGPGVIGFFNPWTLTNKGEIRVRGSVHDGVDLYAGRSVVNRSSGSIEGGDDGVFLSTNFFSCHCSRVSVTNEGSIVGRNGEGVEFDVRGDVTNSGTIQGATYGVLINGGAGSVTNTGQIHGATGIGLGAGGSITNSGSITGSFAGITTTGDSVVMNRGTIGGGSFAVQFGAGNDQLHLDTGSVLNGVVEGGGGTDDIVLDGSGTEDGPFQNFESLVMQGHTWTLGGISTVANIVVTSGTLNVLGSITGATQVLDGTLHVDGTVNGAAMVDPTGRLSGSGTVGSVTNFGTVAPGNSIGTLNVAGNFTSQPGSQFEVQVDDAGQSDRVAATGSATLNGGTVVVIPDEGASGAALDYTILTAAGGVTGTFSNLVENFPFLDHRLTYLPTSVLLSAFRNSNDFETAARCPNQFATAGAFDLAENDPGNTADMNAAVAHLIGEGNPEAARSFLDQTGAPGRPNADFVNLQSMRVLQEAVTTRAANLNLDPSLPGLGFAATGGAPGTNALAGGNALAAVSAAPPAPDGDARSTGAWLRGIGLFGNRNASSCPGQGYQYDLGGAALGFDHAIGSAFAFGAAFATGNSNASVKGVPNNLHALHTHGALYGAWTPGYDRDVRVTGAFTAGWIDNGSGRSIQSQLIQRQAVGDFGSLAFSGALQASAIAWSPGGFAVRPVGGFRFFSLGDRAYTETGANALDLVVRNHDVQSLRSELGAHVSRLFPLDAGWSLEPGIEALWSYELLSVDQTVDARFSGSPTAAFSIVGDRPERNRALLAAGVVARLDRWLALSASYGADLSGDETSQTVQVGLRWQW